MTLLIKDTMEVTKTDFMDFSLSIFLANIGGSLGLWLGLGVLQLGQVVIQGGQAGWAKVGFKLVFLKRSKKCISGHA